MAASPGRHLAAPVGPAAMLLVLAGSAALLVARMYRRR
jgi:hypothetical protein